MRLRTLVTTLFVLLATASRAEQGMWMPQQIPDLAPRLAAAGFKGDPKAFADLTGQPMGAIVSLGGCSASFVSPDGLIVTNHHCVQGALQYNSKPERNLIKDGFVAQTRAEELPNGPGSRVFVTVSVKDVTAQILGSLPKQGDLQVGEELERRVKERTALCEKGGLRCTVASFFEGGKWLEIGQLELQDVRLVMAPPEAVGNFGGETDNWQWPRHAGDFSFYRAYVAPDGKAAPFAKENVPYKPAHWLPVSKEGVKEGDFVIVAGYPGRTQRLATYSQMRDMLEWSYPRTVRRAKEQLAILDALSKGSKETAIKVTPRVRGLANSMKNRVGQLEGVARGGLLEKKRAAEQAFLAWVEQDPKRKAEYGGAIAGLEALQAEREKTRERDLALAEAVRASSLLEAAHTAWRLAEERPKKDGDRDPAFQQRNWTRIKDRMERMERSYDAAADRAMLRYSLLEAAALPAAQRVPGLDAAIGLTPALPAAEAAKKVDAYLDGLYAGTRLTDKAERLAALEKSSEALKASQDSFLALAAALAPLEKQVREEGKARAGAATRLGPVYGKALLAHAGGLLAPDANSTLRVTFGQVQGVSPRDGLVYKAQTTLAGVLEKDKPGDKEFELPKALREAIVAQQAAKAGPWVDARLGDVPVDFLSSVDTTGGNSGSAVLDAKGRLVGLLFDGTYETIASDLLYDVEKTRSIQVDIRYTLWFLQKVAVAPHLLAELGVAN